MYLVGLVDLQIVDRPWDFNLDSRKWNKNLPPQTAPLKLKLNKLRSRSKMKFGLINYYLVFILSKEISASVNKINATTNYTRMILCFYSSRPGISLWIAKKAIIAIN